MGRGKEDAHRATFGLAEKCRALRAGGIHDRAHVIHSLFEGRYPAVAVRQTSAAFIEAYDPAERPQASIELGGIWKIPMQLDIPDEPVDYHEIQRAASEHLISDMDFAAFGVPGLGRRHHVLPVRR